MDGVWLACPDGGPLDQADRGRGHGQLAGRPCPQLGCWGPAVSRIDPDQDQAGWLLQCQSFWLFHRFGHWAFIYIGESFKFSFTELCYYHYFNNVFDTDLANKNPSSGSQALWTCTHPFLRFPFFPGTTECYRFILYFRCPGIKVRHFSKKHGSFLYLEIEIGILGVLIAVAVTTGFRSSVNTAGK